MPRLIAHIPLYLGLLAASCIALAAAPELSDAEKEQFLLSAKVGPRKTLSIGITGSERATLKRGALAHDAHIQDVDELKRVHEGPYGLELNFRDSYIFNVAGYRLDRMIGLNMVPVSVVRKIGGTPCSVTWWVDDVLMMERERNRKGVAIPDPAAWNNQMYSVRVFNELVANTDANLGNVLITKDWRIRIIDFTRGFRMPKKVLKPKNLPERVDRRLLAGLKGLTAEDVQSQLGELLRPPEIKGLLGRRDQIVKHFEKLIEKRGEGRVLYGEL